VLTIVKMSNIILSTREWDMRQLSGKYRSRGYMKNNNDNYYANLRKKMEQEARQVKASSKELKPNNLGLPAMSFSRLIEIPASDQVVTNRAPEEDILLAGNNAGEDFELVD
jgi:hypothetical protein